MKFILSLSEITAIIRERYNLSDDVDIQIATVTTNKVYDAVVRIFSNLGPHNKIAAIKAMRIYAADTLRISLGLGDAKFAVEHPDSFKDFVLQHGRFPEAGYGVYENGRYVETYR